MPATKVVEPQIVATVTFDLLVSLCARETRITSGEPSENMSSRSKSNTSINEDATFCSKHGSIPLLQRLAATQPPQSTPSQSPKSYTPVKDSTRTYALFGFVSAFLSLFIVPEISGSVAIILGAYAWRKEQGNLGITIVILGIIFMIVGIYFASYFALIDLLPS
jgi:hypothetical protein